MSGPGAGNRKLVIASESLGGAEAALALCRTILKWSPARPTGIIVEPVVPSFWAGREPRLVSTGGALLTVPPLERLRRIAKGDAAELGARLSSLAKAVNTEWECRLSSGELVSAASAALSEGDILLLCQRPVFRSQSRVLVLGTEKGVSDASRHLAEALAHASASAISVLLPTARADQDEIVDLVEQRHAGVVVIDLDAGPVEGEESLRRLYSAARCPIVALGAARIRRGMTQDR